MSAPGQEFVEVFLQEASEHLQFLREYSGILQDPYPTAGDVERLYLSAHTLGGASAMYGYPLFAEVSGKLAHIFQYAMNATIGAEAAGPLVEFISEAVAVLESDLLLISDAGTEAVEDINAFKQKYPFAFQAAVTEPESEAAPAESAAPAAPAEIEDLPPDGDIPAEILEFFVPEVEEHLQAVTECLLALEANPNSEDINRLFRAMHTIKGSAAQVGLQRIALVAHRAEDLIGRLRDGILQPSAGIVDLCLESVDTLKKFLYRQWLDEATMQTAVKSLLGKIARLAPAEAEVSAEATPVTEETAAAPEAAKEAEAEPVAGRKEPAAMGQSKSVRVALERLDQMMNVVGELVINRTRMVGRLAELEKLADVLNFSKARMSDKVAEFQDKHEFSRLNAPTLQEPPTHGIAPFRGGYSSYTHSYDHSLAEFSELEMDRYDDFAILSRSLTEISADITEVLTQLDGFVRRVDSDIDEFTKLAHRLQDEITQIGRAHV